ncbi:MAG TPA: SDR family oxidoreductase [Pirellulaceae bacterium]|nr:SDR family oxidoreductase [Pirellulaceae bacterium]HMO93528.1 SDR family oxidoreductase [Pirellulaceae bacterium]HMP70360.1 SDR family oxidoreductase [Pirellulaceae bacterium]
MAFDFLQLDKKRIVVFGVANKKSVAYFIGKTLIDAGCRVDFVVRSDARHDQVGKLFPNSSIYVCDVEDQSQIERVALAIGSSGKIDGLVHSIAFADYEGGMKPFHLTGRRQFLRTLDISCFSLIAIANAFSQHFNHDASVVTVSISTTKMASENYGFMAPIKAALDSSIVFLNKSFSNFSNVRFNAVAPGLLKTSASAGIPGYVDAYLYAEQIIPRRRAVQTQEAADVACFLLSPRSSGIVAQSIVVDAGMAINYFDQKIIDKVMEIPKQDQE